MMALLLLAGCGKAAHDAPVDVSEAAGGPTAASFSAEEGLEVRTAEAIQPLYGTGEDGTLVGVDGVELHYHVQRVEKAKGAVVLLPGRTEAVAKYAEVMFDLNAQGYSVYALDHRGQGESERMLPNRFKGYVKHFDDYVTDLQAFVETVVRPEEPAKLFLLAHSMGGAVSVLHAAKHPGTFDAIAMSAPMLDIATGAFPAPVASALSLTSCSTSGGTDYAVGSGDYAKETDFAQNSVTHSQARWALKIQQIEDTPSIQLGGVTYHFVCESLRACNRAQQTGPLNPVPTLLLQAGGDTIVLPQAQVKYCAEAPGCQLSRFEGAKHELLMESDATRNEALAQVVRFFNHFAAEN